ncbi:MAG: Wzz/FepE/Etk N-terminal domain-containing protein, partial [Bacteroidota bacterium]
MLNSAGGQANDLEQYKERITKFSTEFELGLFLLLLRKSIIWIGIFTFLSASIAFVYLRYTQPIYQSKTTIQLASDNDANKILEVSGPNDNQNQLAEALEILRSPSFLKRVLSKLNISNGYFNEGTFRNNELYNNSPFLIVSKVKNNLLYNTKIYVNYTGKDAGEINYKLNNSTNNLSFKNEIWSKNNDIEIMVFQNTKIQKEQFKSGDKTPDKVFFIPYTEDFIISSLQSKIDVRIMNEQARTIEITIKDINPEKASDIANLMAEEFIVFEREVKRASSQSVINFINEQLNTISDTLRSSENNLVDYAKRKNISADQEVIRIKMGRLGPIEDQVLKAQIDLSIIDTMIASLNRNKAIDSYQLLSVVTGSSEEGTIRDQISSLSKLLMQKEEL